MPKREKLTKKDKRNLILVILGAYILGYIGVEIISNMPGNSGTSWVNIPGAFSLPMNLFFISGMIMWPCIALGISDIATDNEQSFGDKWIEKHFWIIIPVCILIITAGLYCFTMKFHYPFES